MGTLARRHCSHSLYNYFSKFLSNLLIKASDVDFYSMASISVLYFSEFILYILLKSSPLFDNLQRLMCSIPFVEFLFCFSYFEKIYFSLEIIYLPIVQENHFCLIFLQNINLTFQLSFRCSCIFFRLSKLCVIFYLYYFVIHWVWWLLPEATSQSHPFIFGTLPYLSQLYPFSS